MMHRALILAAGALVAASLAWVPSAQACSWPSCSGSWVFPAGGEIPSDRFVITYFAGAVMDDGGVALPRMTRTSDGGVVDVPFEAVPVSGPSSNGRVQLIPSEQQPVGATILLETITPASCLLGGPLREAYQVIAPPPLPSSLGTLTASVYRGQLQAGVAPDQRCWDFADVTYADVNIALDASATAFASQLSYMLFVDGAETATFEPFVPHSIQNAKPWSLTRAPARIFAYCRAERGWPGNVGLGKHIVRMQATLGELSLSTPEIEVELKCEGPAPTGPHDPAPDASVDATPVGGGAGGDAGGDTGRDAAASVDALPKVDAMDGCRLASTRTFAGAAWIGLALMLRRRRQAR